MTGLGDCDSSPHLDSHQYRLISSVQELSKYFFFASAHAYTLSVFRQRATVSLTTRI